MFCSAGSLKFQFISITQKKTHFISFQIKDLKESNPKQFHKLRQGILIQTGQ